MRLLLDSSGAELVCALADERGVVIERREAVRSEPGQDISVVAGQVLGVLLPSDIGSIVVGLGPGTFIGTRIAISYANGLAIAGGIPLFGVGSLAAIATVHGAGRYAVLRDASRGEVYWYGPAESGTKCRLVSMDSLAREFAQNIVESAVIEVPEVVGEAQAERLAKLVETAASAGVRIIQCPGVPAEGLRRAQAGVKAARYVEPLYLRGYLR